jgi:DNA-binding transcriptional ArsR family regulator
MAVGMEKFVSVFKALSDPTRLQILQIIEAKPRSVSEIVDFFSLSQPTISRHLAALANARLVKSEKREQQKFYSLEQENLKKLLAGYFGKFECCRGFIIVKQT